jgi:hypothetical protein
MTEYNLQPSYIRLDYHSAYGPHSATIQTRQWLPTSITGAMGSYVAWNSVPIDAEDMIDAFVAVAKKMLPPTSQYDLATIWNWDSGAERFFPVATKSLGVAGTSGTGSPNKSISFTINLRSTGGQNMKLVFLDYVHTGLEFNKIGAGAFSADQLAVANEVGDINNAWAARDNTRPDAIISGTFDINDALRKQYRMV